MRSLWVVLALSVLGNVTGAKADRLDPTTLSGKLIMGYQGWFACPGDAAARGWVHWSADGNSTVDMLPDLSEFAPSERCATDMVGADGHAVGLFSSQSEATVERHFGWMEQYGLDGVALQRFASQVLKPSLLAAVDHVLANVRHAAEHHGRVFFVMYDLSGMTPDTMPAVVQDWGRLMAQGVTASPAYQRHRGHPVLGLWGLGFVGRPITPKAALDLLAGLEQVSAPYGGVTFLGGVPGGWRTGTGDAAADPGWQQVWPKLGVISAWTVGRYADDAGADAYRKTVLEPDLQMARRIGVDDMPVVFPGFSWANLMRARHAVDKAIPNQIPRRCGRFYWQQVVNAMSAGATMMYGAMFDEVDEGTAMFKIVPSAAEVPLDSVTHAPAFVTLDADGCQLPSDWYLRLAGAATKALNDKVVPSDSLPFALPGP